MRIAESDYPMLHLAAANRHVEALAYLLGRGADIDATNMWGHTALEVALDTGHVANAKWLLEHEADPNHLDGRGFPPLSYAYDLDPSVVQCLIQAGANPKYRSPNGMGLMDLLAVTHFTDTKVADILIKYGVSPDEPMPVLKVTPLMQAAANQNNLMARWLLKHRADLNARDANGRSVFDYARMSNTLHTDEFFRENVLTPPKAPKKPTGKNVAGTKGGGKHRSGP